MCNSCRVNGGSLKLLREKWIQQQIVNPAKARSNSLSHTWIVCFVLGWFKYPKKKQLLGLYANIITLYDTFFRDTWHKCEKITINCYPSQARIEQTIEIIYDCLLLFWHLNSLEMIFFSVDMLGWPQNHNHIFRIQNIYQSKRLEHIFVCLSAFFSSIKTFNELMTICTHNFMEMIWNCVICLSNLCCKAWIGWRWLCLFSLILFFSFVQISFGKEKWTEEKRQFDFYHAVYKSDTIKFSH